MFRNRLIRDIKKSKKIYYSEFIEINIMNIKKHGQVSEKL